MADHAVVADDEVDLSRRKFLTRATIATGAVGVAFAAVPFIASWNPSERARAEGEPIRMDLDKIDPGQMATTIWRKTPIYVVRRTPDMLARLNGHDSELKDPHSEDSDQPAYAKNTQRSRTAEFLVLIGVCTHLGCLPKPRPTSGCHATRTRTRAPSSSARMRKELPDGRKDRDRRSRAAAHRSRGTAGEERFLDVAQQAPAGR